jgi:hypothetical protein
LAPGQLEYDVPTTLDRIHRETAMALIARGYASTLAGTHVFGFADADLMIKSWLTRERLERLTG